MLKTDVNKGNGTVERDEAGSVTRSHQKTQLVANDTTAVRCQGPGATAATGGHNGLNDGHRNFASQTPVKDTQIYSDPCVEKQNMYRGCIML